MTDKQLITSLTKQVETLSAQVAFLMKREEELTNKVEELTKENAHLRERLSKYETPKNSNNSSVPPSKDENRPQRNKSLRKKSDRKAGGQQGRKGKTLNMVDQPDVEKKHEPQYCQCCGANLDAMTLEYAGKRQVIDIPPIEPIITEHQIFKCTCNCGHTTTSSFPQGINTPVSYGENLQSLIGYFYARQYLPFKRMQEMFNDVFGLSISEGGIHCLLNKIVEKAQPAYQLIKQKLTNKKTTVIGSDETGMKVNTDKHWAWTWQNHEATFITITDNRGIKSIKQNFNSGFSNAVLVHDCWKSHFNTTALSHQLCIAHLLRDLNYLDERYEHKWSRICKMLFYSALQLKDEMSVSDYYQPCIKRKSIEKRLDQLLDYPISKDFKEMVTFQKRLIKYRDYLFVFLYHPQVPPDNNASERAIRNIKVKQKISGQFKSPKGAFNFTVLRSITDTAIKNGRNILETLKCIATLQTD